jgi:hypothetical protein
MKPCHLPDTAETLLKVSDENEAEPLTAVEYANELSTA